MRLYIAEKPSLGRAIAAALPGPQKKSPGAIHCGEQQVVSWCIGHLLEPAEPADYTARWKIWQLADLPILPERWKLVGKKQTAGQLKILANLLKQADEVIHAGDPDREGQLLVDEVLWHFRFNKPVRRVLINDLNPAAVKKALAQEQDNRNFRALAHSALARQRADWLFGINLTRAYTLVQRQQQPSSLSNKPVSTKRQGQSSQSVYSIGRVQTPVLGLVVARDLSIENFVAHPFYLLDMLLRHEASNTQASLRWVPDDRHAAVVDDESRLIDAEFARNLLARLQGKTGEITLSQFQDRKEAPPLPLSLSALQIEAGRLYQLSAKQVLDAAQTLYEQHQLITYPRSDCRYLPEGHYAEAVDIIAAIRHHAQELTDACDASQPDLRSKAWNDAKVDAHHAIIPTCRSGSIRLSATESQIYALICRYYLMQFYPEAIHREGKLTALIEDETFRASETCIASPGWRQLEPRGRQPHESSKPPLPHWPLATPVRCVEGAISERQTQPPTPFTDSSLLAAMTGIARFVSDAQLRKTLRETDGLGTEATRASIIETLFKRLYLVKKGRYIHATDKGRILIAALPEALSKPDMTAEWEARLEAIRQQQDDPKVFLNQLQARIGALLHPLKTSHRTHPVSNEAHAIELPSSTSSSSTTTEPVMPQQTSTAGEPECPLCQNPMQLRNGRYGNFWSCQRFPRCKGTRATAEARPAPAKPAGGDRGAAPIPCPSCHAPLKQRKGPRGIFWGCTNYPSCRKTFADLDGQPQLTP